MSAANFGTGNTTSPCTCISRARILSPCVPPQPGRASYRRLIGAEHRALFEQAEKEAPGFAFVVRHMSIDFRKPAFMDDILDIVTTPEEVKGASVTLNQKVMRGGDLIVEAHVQVAF